MCPIRNCTFSVNARQREADISVDVVDESVLPNGHGALSPGG